MKKIGTIILIACAATGCNSVRRGEPITGPMELNPRQEAGRIVFQQRCHQCHPYGGAGLGPALNNKPAPARLIKTQVRAGLGAMPRFEDHIIAETDLDDLISYVIALRKADGETEARPEEKSDTAEQKKEDRDANEPTRATRPPPRQTK